MSPNRNVVILLIIAAFLGAFFYFALLYPLSFSLLEAVREPTMITANAGETFSQIAARAGVSEQKLLKLNKLEKAPEKISENQTFVIGGQWTPNHVLRIFDHNAAQWRWMINSLLLAGSVTLICALISYPLAYWQSRFSFWKQNLLGGLLLLPLVMPPFVGAIGLRRMLSKYGTFNLILMDLGIVDPAHPIDFLDNFRLFGCILVMVLHFYPLIYLNLAASISNIDPALTESAKSLGLTPFQTFRRVIVPLSMPGFLAGATLVFVGAFMDLGTPLVFGFDQTVARQIYSLANEQSNNPLAPALVLVVTVLVLAIFAAMRWAGKRMGGAGGGVKGQSRAAARQLSPRMTAIVVGVHVVVILAAIVPHLSVFLNAIGGRWFMTVLPENFTTSNLSEAVTHPIAVIGMRNSILYALISTVIDVGLGVACAWAIVRRRGWWGRMLDAMTVAPLAIPGLVLAFGYVGAYSDYFTKPTSIFGTQVTLGVGVFLILSYAIRRLPYTVRSSAAGLEQTPPMLEEAARGLGMHPFAVLVRVTLPLISANVLAGAILAFSFAMLEVSDSIVLATRPQDFPLTKAIYSLFGNPGNGDQLASALGLIALIFLSLSLFAAGSMLGKRLGQMFRA